MPEKAIAAVIEARKVADFLDGIGEHKRANDVRRAFDLLESAEPRAIERCKIRLGLVSVTQILATSRIASSRDHSALIRDLVEALDDMTGFFDKVPMTGCYTPEMGVKRKALAALAAAKQAMGASGLAAPAQPEMPIKPEIIGTSPEMRKRLEHMGRGESPEPVVGGVVEPDWIARLPLVKRLVLEHAVGEVDPVDGTADAWAYRNPDGPQAVALVEMLTKALGEVDELLWAIHGCADKKKVIAHLKEIEKTVHAARTAYDAAMGEKG